MGEARKTPFTEDGQDEHIAHDAKGSRQQPSSGHIRKGGRKVTQTSWYQAQLMVQILVEERRREADRQRLLRQVQSDPPGWLMRQGLALLYRLGCMLIALGQRLQPSASAPTGAPGSEKRARP